MNIRYFIDPETNKPHIHRHGVTEAEVEDVLGRPIEDRAGKEGARVAIGQTRGGRYLRVIYVRETARERFVITALDLGRKGFARAAAPR